MNVASLELCKELYELSGYEPGEFGFYYTENVYEDGSSLWNIYNWSDTKNNPNGSWVPAYTVGDLLDILPKRTKLRKLGAGYAVQWQKNGADFRNEEWHFEAVTAADCLAMLAIELFEKDVLKKEGS